MLLKTCLLRKGGFNHPKYEYLIEILCESFSINNKLRHLIEKALEFNSTEVVKRVEMIYIDSQTAFILETLVMSKILNVGDLNTEVNLSISVH